MFLSEKSVCYGIWPVLFFFIAIEPLAFTADKFKALDILYEMAIFGMFYIVLVLHIVMLRRGSQESCHSRIPYLVMLYYGYILLVTAINGNPVYSVFMRGIQFVNFALYVDLVLKNNPEALFTTGLNILTLWVFLNCVTYFVFPGGLYSDGYFDNCFLLGYDNQNINFILPALIFVLIKHQYYKKCTFQILFTYVLALITVIRAWSGMSLIIVFSTSLFGLFFFKRKSGFVVTKILNGTIFNLFNLFIINVVSFIALVFFHVQEYFEYLITVILGKGMSLSGRMRIWEIGISFIKKRPIFGYGQELQKLRTRKSGSWLFGLHCHNRFLEVMYTGGVVLLGIYLSMIFYTIYCLKEVRETFFGKIIAFGLFIYLMGMLTEQYPYCPFFWIFMVMAENAKIICEPAEAGV